MKSTRIHIKPPILLISASIIGTLLEFYGFSLFLVFGDIIAAHFFPTQEATLSLLWVYAIVASSFLMRPLGAAVFGYIGDKYGRHWALYLSIILMGLTLLMIGILPTYQSIGVLAQILIVLCRLLQGMCAGGEYNNAGIFAIENFAKRPALAGSLIAFGAGMGGLLAMTMKQFFYSPLANLEAWRLPFIMGAIMSFMGVFLRRRLKEFFLIEVPKSFPWKLLLDYKTSALTAFSIGAIDGAFAYVTFGFMGTYLHLFIGLQQDESIQICMYALGAYLIFAPLIGYLADYVNTHILFKTIILIIIPTTYFVFILISSRSWIFILPAMLMFSLMYSAISALQHAYLLTLFPPQLRSRGVGVSFSLGGALFGGCAPLILTSLLGIYSNNMIPGYFLILVSFFCLAACMMKSSKKPSPLAAAPL